MNRAVVRGYTACSHDMDHCVCVCVTCVCVCVCVYLCRIGKDSRTRSRRNRDTIISSQWVAARTDAVRGVMNRNPAVQQYHHHVIVLCVRLPMTFSLRSSERTCSKLLCSP